MTTPGPPRRSAADLSDLQATSPGRDADHRTRWATGSSGERWGCGRWSLELRGDELADIRCDGAIVLRAVRAVARDRDWQTAWPTVTRVRSGATSLVVDIDIDDLGIDLAGRITVRAHGDRIEFALEASVRSESWTNRTGLVALHPPRLAGEALTVRHIDGSTTPMAFPAHISPHQPARDIAALAWSDHGTPLRMDLEGEVFEMEDQRNWTDGSFKTYSRSLDEPFPYLLAAGSQLRQRLTLDAGRPGMPPHTPEDPLRIWLITEGRFPMIAVGASTAPDPAPEPHDSVTAHQHVELDLADPAWPAALERARREAEDLSVLLVARGVPDLTDVARALERTPLRWIGIVDAQSHTSTRAATSALRQAMPRDSPIVGGSRSHFTELNRAWDSIPWADIDGLTFPTTPLFHVLETEQLVEALHMQRLVAEDVTSRAPDVPVHVGPVSLRPRFNNVATSISPSPTRTDLAHGYGSQHSSAVDLRQQSAELAAWTVASAAALAVPGVASLTYFEAWGPRGVRTADGDVLPVHGAVAALTEMQGRQMLTSASPDGRVWALGSVIGGTVEVLLANLGEQEHRVVLELDGRELGQVQIPALTWQRQRWSGSRLTRRA